MRRKMAQGILVVYGIGVLGFGIWGLIQLGVAGLIVIGTVAAIGLLAWALGTVVDDSFYL